MRKETHTLCPKCLTFYPKDEILLHLDKKHFIEIESYEEMQHRFSAVAMFEEKDIYV